MSSVIELSNGSIIRRFISFIIDYIILAPFILILYQFWKDKLWNGQSIGNKLVKIQLIDFKTGGSPSFLKVVIKNIIFLITLGLGSLLIFLNDGNRSLGDIVCSTIIVKTFN